MIIKIDLEKAFVLRPLNNFLFPSSSFFFFFFFFFLFLLFFVTLDLPPFLIFVDDLAMTEFK